MAVHNYKMNAELGTATYPQGSNSSDMERVGKEFVVYRRKGQF